jgi:hypothetical protein
MDAGVAVVSGAAGTVAEHRKPDSLVMRLREGTKNPAQHEAERGLMVGEARLS